MPAIDQRTPVVSSGIGITFWFRGARPIWCASDVLLRDEIVDRLRALAAIACETIAWRGLGLRQALPRASASRKADSFWPSTEDRRLLSPSALRIGLAEPFGVEDRGALVALSLHLPAHRIDEVGSAARCHDLDARDLMAPGHGGVVDDASAGGVDLVALGERLVEVIGRPRCGCWSHRQVHASRIQVV